MIIQTPNNSRYFLLVGPAIITFVFMSLVVIATLKQAGGDPLALARIGTRYSLSDPNGTEGYDGQFNYYIALNPDPGEVAKLIDIPAYRYQRILLPITVRWISLCDPKIIPWVFPIINIIVHALGTGICSLLLTRMGVSGWYALIYGLWVGFSLAIRLDLSEGMAFFFLLLAYLCDEEKEKFLSAIFLCLAFFSKEVILIFGFGLLVAKMYFRDIKAVLLLFLFAFLPFGIFQIWLWQVFGELGIGSGGAMASGFEFIPLGGLFKIGTYSKLYMEMMAIVFLPCTILPALWGVIGPARDMLKCNIDVYSLAFFINGLVILFLPFSTFRETGGLLRFSCGIILCLILYSAKKRNYRILHYAYFLIVYNVFLIKPL